MRVVEPAATTPDLRAAKRRIIAYNYVFKPQVFTLTNLSGVKPRQDLGQNGVEDMIQLT